ncbi:hypothetical protein ACJMK2_014461 [Sinanodonta woodiana]|uniref:Uncharacterized protein n=1 Tax=Sinanodonta woodiana TaxID=1069815 RepID=A0ABD3V0Q3_SINWO
MVDTTNGSIQVSLFSATVSETLETTTDMDKFSGIPGENIFYSWFPTVFLGIFMVVFLIVSFTRYHRKFVRKRNAHNEYLEYQLAAKHPRIGSSLCKTHNNGYTEVIAPVGFDAFGHVLADGEHIKELPERRSEVPHTIALSSNSTKMNKIVKQLRSQSMEIPGILIENVHEGMDADRKYIFGDEIENNDIRKGKSNGTLKTSQSLQSRYDVLSGSEQPANRSVDFNNKGEFSNCENVARGLYSNTNKTFGGFKTGASCNPDLVIENYPTKKSRIDTDYYSDRDNNPFVSEEFDNIAICQLCHLAKHNSYYEDLGLPTIALKMERKTRKETSPKPGGFINYDTGHILVESHGKIDSPSYDSVRHLPVLDNQYYENVAKDIFNGPSFVGLRRNSAFQNDVNVVNNSTKVEVEVYTLNNSRLVESGTRDADNQLHEQTRLDPGCEPLYFDVSAKRNYSKETFECAFQHTNETRDGAKNKHRNGHKNARYNSRKRLREETSLASEDGKVFWLDIDNISTTSL